MDPADQYDKDAKRFMATFRRFATVNFGERCPDFDDGCYTCKLWQLIDQVDEIVTGECGDGPGIHKSAPRVHFEEVRGILKPKSAR